MDRARALLRFKKSGATPEAIQRFKKNGDSSDVLSVESPSESPLNPPYESPVGSRCLTATILLLFCNAEMLYGYSQASHIELFLLETSKNVYCNEAAIKVRPF